MRLDQFLKISRLVPRRSLAQGLASDVTLGKPRKHKDKHKHKKKDRKNDKKKDKSSVRPVELSCDGQIVYDTCHAFFEQVEHQEYCLDTCRECEGTGRAEQARSEGRRSPAQRFLLTKFAPGHCRCR